LEKQWGAASFPYINSSLQFAKYLIHTRENANFQQAEQLLKNANDFHEAFIIQQYNEGRGLVGTQDYTEGFALMGILRHEQQRYQEALDWYAKAISRMGMRLTLQRPAIRMNQGRVLFQLDDIEQSLTYLKPAIQDYLALIDKTFPSLSEYEKQLFFHQIRDDFNFFNYYGLMSYQKDSTTDLVADMYNYQLTTKALIMTSSKRIRALIQKSGDAVLQQKYAAWTQNRDYLANLHLSDQELIKRGIKVDSIRTVTNQLEKELAIRSRAFEESLEGRRYTWRDVQVKLQENEAAIEIIRITHGKKVFYIALIVTKDAEKPRLVVLPNGNSLEGKFLKYYRTAIEFRIADRNSYQQFWLPIQQVLNQLGTINKVYLSPDGVYNQINLKGMLNPNTSKYLMDELKIQVITRTDELLSFQTKPIRSQGKALLLGKPTYQLDQLEEVKNADGRSFRGTRKIAALKNVAFDELPGTLVEVDSIEVLLAKNDWTVSKKVGKQALEGVLKAEVANFNIIHLATHGFFLGQQTPDTSLIPSEERAFMPIKERRTMNGLDPMLQSGIILAGVNNYDENDVSAVEDGILTAYEVLGMDLSNIDLVVLSACETGLGEVQSGEGVYGLQRATKVAGADAVMMSLWKVNDDATQALMRAFYEAWLQTGDKRAAFEIAQLKVRQQFPDPYYWAAFVMIGN